MPSNIDDNRASHLANTFGCKVGSMPFTYLGLPLGTTKPSLLEFTPPLLSRIERRLSGMISKFLAYNGRFTLVNSDFSALPTLVNSDFSALPTFYMCSLKIPCQVIKQIDVFKKHCLWSKDYINRRGSYLAALETIRKQKSQGS